MVRIVVASLLLVFGFQLGAQTGKYRYHTVLKGETLFSISQKYQISVQEILDLNPEVDENIKTGQTLLLPYTEKEPVQNDPENTYRVKSGDTWYSISRTLECSVQQLQAANKEVFERGPLQIGSLLNIPEAQKVVNDQGQSLAVRHDSVHRGVTYHYVQPGETWYSIARTYGSKPSQLLQLNPELGGELPAQTWVVVKQSSKVLSPVEEQLASDEVLQDTTKTATDLTTAAEVAEISPIPPVESTAQQAVEQQASQADTNQPEEPSFILYKIEKRDRLREIAQKFNTTEDYLLQLNPELAEGLQEGRYIIVPVIEKPSESTQETPSRDGSSGKMLRMAIMLPFGDAGADTLTAYELGETRNGKMRLRASAFYAGAILAADSLSQIQDSLLVKVYDTRNSTQVLDSLSQDPFLLSSQICIGPLYGKNAEYLDAQLKGDHRPRVFSPLSANLKSQGRKELIDLYPQDQVGLQAVAHYFKRKKQDTLYWVATGSGTAEEQKWLETLRAEWADVPWMEDGKKFFTPLEKEGFSQSSLRALKKEGRQLLIVNLSKDPANMADIERKAFALNDSAVLVSIHEWPANLKQEAEYLNGLRLTYPQAFYVDYSRPEVKRFVSLYRERFQAEPDVFAFQAWDSMFLTHALWQKNFSGELLEWQGLQSTYRLQWVDGRWTNQGMSLLRMEDYRWLRIH